MGEAVLGARGEAAGDVEAWMDRLRRTAKGGGLSAQAVDARAACGRVHLESALVHARRAFARGTQLARTLETEWVLCVAGVRQVDVAFASVGVRRDAGAFGLLLLAEGAVVAQDVDALLSGMGLERDDTVLECDREALQRIGVAVAELGAVPEGRWPDLALERVAMLDLER